MPNIVHYGETNGRSSESEMFLTMCDRDRVKELTSCHDTKIVFSEHSDAISSEIVNILES
jgi:hypothetical protein